ncbi:hypothetical protein ONE63_004730 [Megalurothrips usitatus]|uniref:PID domain-containing protein n=1 Tax=Megalurothrips usitatus TaxID=439358 RepID=A0AAV7X3S8_9NEOP|nr:hypothetical protein ONE63_004730 [Megalurothrips usitatus]
MKLVPSGEPYGAGDQRWPCLRRAPSWGCGLVRAQGAPKAGDKAEAGVSAFRSPGRTPGRFRRPRGDTLHCKAKHALMKKFSSSASAWVTSTPIIPNNNNNIYNNKDAMMTPPARTAAAAPQQQEQQPSLPQSFAVKCLGWRESRGLWGVKHTRAPVDAMVAAARSLPPGQSLARATLEVSSSGVRVDGDLLPIDCISYGVQDLVYTRVFCCVLVSRPDAAGPPFRCHAFVCESRAQARALTYALAAAFQEYSRAVKRRQAGGGGATTTAPATNRVVDLRTPEDIAAEMLSQCQDSEA